MTVSYILFGLESGSGTGFGSGTEGGGLLSEMQRISFQDGVEQAWSATELNSLLQSPGTFALVISKQDQPMGFILTRQAATEAEILTICVVPDHRRKRVASKLLQAFFDRARADGINEIFLEVSEHNGSAIGLYEKSGFTKVGQRKNYYGGRGEVKHDALVMKFSL